MCPGYNFCGAFFIKFKYKTGIIKYIILYKHIFNNLNRTF